MKDVVNVRQTPLSVRVGRVVHQCEVEATCQAVLRREDSVGARAHWRVASANTHPQQSITTKE